MQAEIRRTAIGVVGNVPWGTHFCQFYQTKQDLIEVLVPYFKTGLEDNELCMWITSQPLDGDEAKRALAENVQDLDAYVAKGQLQILDYTDWYTKSGRFNAKRVLNGWVKKEQEALRKGFAGLRLSGNTFWLKKGNWKDFADYEAAVNSVIGKHRMLAVCTYSLDRCNASEVVDVVSNHEFALIRRRGQWEVIESAAYKQLVDSLRQSEERFRQLAENIRQVFWLYDLDADEFVYVSPAYETIFGRTRQGLYEDVGHWLDFVHPDDRPRIRQSFQKEKQGIPFQDDYRIVRPDGDVRWINDRGFAISDGTGRVYRIAGIAEDITERRLAEQEIVGLARFPSENPDPVMRISKQGFLLYANDACTPFLNKWGCLVDSPVPAKWRQTAAKVLGSKLRKTVEAEAAGRVFAFAVTPMPDADYVTLYGQDITERKDMELRQKLARDVLERLNQQGQPAELISDVLVLIRSATGFAATGIRLADGDDFPYFEVNGFSEDFVQHENYLCARDEAGKQLYGFDGRAALECVCGWVLSGRSDPALPFFSGGGSFWTNSTTKLLQSPPAELAARRTRNRCNEAGYESVALIPLRAGDEIVGLLQLNDTWPGRFNPEMIRFFESIADSIGIALSRARAEEALRHSEQRYSLAQRAANIGSWDWSIPTGELKWSERIEPMFGFGPGEFGGTYQAFLDCVHLHDRQFVQDSVDACVADGRDYAIEHRIVWSDGTVRWVSETGNVIRDAGGKAVRMLGVAQDITDRKKAEEDLDRHRQHLEELVQNRTAELTDANTRLLRQIEQRKALEREILSISEREQRRIGQELHDSIGQQLTGIAFMAKVLEQKLAAESAERVPDVVEISQLVRQATDQARALAKGLHPLGLDEESLMSALQELAANTEHLFGISCTFKCETPVPIHDTETAIHLYRVAQEAVTNAIRHGRAHNVEIELTAAGDMSKLTVANDGTAFSAEQPDNTGMGLKIMHHRAEMIEGMLDIGTSETEGTVVTCTFPNRKR